MKLLTLLLAMLSATAGIACTVDDVDRAIGRGHQQVADYVAKNVSLFAEKYQEEMEDETFSPTEVEFRTEVLIVEDDAYGSYLDFDGENGYMLLADNYELLDFSTDGQLDWFKEDSAVVYSRTEGYCFYDEEHNLISFDRLKLARENGYEDFLLPDDVKEEAEDKTIYSRSYDGQLGTDSGGIYDPNGYIRSYYGDGFNLKVSKGNEKASYLGQSDFSVYELYSSGFRASEGNCLISACYLLLKEMMDRGKYRGLPNSTVGIVPQYDSFYYELMNNPRRFGYSSAYVNTRYLPYLYAQLRDYFIRVDGYNVSGAHKYTADNAINAVTKAYGVDARAAITSFYSFDSCVKKEIDNGRPTIWIQALGSYYRNHAVVVTGYKTYEKVTKWWIFKSVEKHSLMMINDNWSATPRYIDYDRMAGSLDGLGGSFLRVK